MREESEKFAAAGAQILITGPDKHETFAAYWAQKSLPFPCLPDPDHKLAKLYGQRWRLFSLGRMPAMVVIDKAGRMRARHDSRQMWDIPTNADVLDLLGKL